MRRQEYLEGSYNDTIDDINRSVVTNNQETWNVNRLKPQKEQILAKKKLQIKH